MKQETDALTQSGKGLVVIIGCDSGIGEALARRMAEREYRLAVSYLHENHFENHQQILAQKTDVENPSEVENFCDAVKHLCKGTLCIIGSLAGKIAMPFLSPYAASKFALEGFCDSLRREMNPFGVKTILIEPAAVATRIWNNAKKQDISFVHEKYMESLLAFQDNFIEGGNKGLPVEAAADRIIAILEKKKPHTRYILARNKMLFHLILRLPSFFLDKAVIKMFNMNYGDGKLDGERPK